MTEHERQLLTDIQARLEALGAAMSDQRLEQLVQQHLDKLLADEQTRKMRFGNDQRLIGSKFSRWNLTASDIEWLYDVLTAAQRTGLSQRGPSEELRQAFQAISEAYYLPEEQVRAIDQQAIDGLFPRIPLAWYDEADRALAAAGRWRETRAYQRAMDTAESGYGAQLVGAQYVADLWEAARRESRVFSLLDQFEMTAPTAYLPVEADLPELLFVAESTEANSSAYPAVKTGSQRVQVSAAKFVIHQMWSGELEEDAILPFVPYLRRQAALSIAHYCDSLVVNGDTTAASGNINSDEAAPGSNKHFLAFDGLRHVGLVDNTNNGRDMNGPLTLAALGAVRGLMRDDARLLDWGHPVDANDLVYVADPETADAIALLNEVVVHKQQNNVPLLAGEVTRILGHPVISSMAVPKTKPNGRVSTTPANNTKGQVVAFNRRGFRVGWRRRVKVEVERLPSTDQMRVVYSLRMGFGRYAPSGAVSSIEAAAVIYNVTV